IAHGWSGQGGAHSEYQNGHTTGGSQTGANPTGDEGGRAGPEDAWARAKSAPAFIAEPDVPFQGLAKDLVAPGAITLIAAPRGVGKPLRANGLAVAFGGGGTFRGEPVQALPALYIDRENPVATLRARLRGWGASAAKDLHVLTRQEAPDLKDWEAWQNFP